MYLDRYVPAADVMTVQLHRVFLIGGTGESPLDLTTGGLSLTEQPPRQIRLVDQTVPADDCRGLRFRMNITYALNDTTVGVDSLDARLDLDQPLGHGDIAAVFFSLHAFGAVGDNGRATAELEVAEPRIPPFNSLIFVTNQESNNISVIDKTADWIVDVLADGERPAGMAFSRLTRELFVANSGDNTVTVFDATTRQTLRRLRLNLGDEPTRLALSPDNRFLYVLNTGSNSLVMFDANSNQELGRFSVGLQSVALDVDPVSGWVYISNELSDNVSVFDPAEQTIVTTIPAGSLPTELVFVSPDNLLCAASSGQRLVTVLSTGTGNQQASARLCSAARGLAYDRVADRMYASSAACNELAVFQPANGLSLGQIPMPGTPGLLTLDTDGRRLMVTLPDENRVAIITLTGSRIASVIDVGNGPYMAVVAQ